MPRPSAEPIVITPAHEQLLTRLVRAHATPQKLAERAQMILLAAAGTGVRETARQPGVWPKTVRHWLGRWRTAAEAMPVAQRLADAPRPGAPATFTPEQICAIVALACEQPSAESDLPLSHWSRSELSRCAVERGIVDRFHFTPKHASWLNQIEIWFSILARKLLRRGSFTSQQDLKERIEQFIAYFNRTMARPFKWTKTGKPLAA